MIGGRHDSPVLCGMFLPHGFRPDTPPQRIVSLVPSISELVYDLGAGNQLVGITRYCVHPAEALQTKVVVGGTKKVVVKRIDSLEPDLILANREENVREQIEALAERYPVWLTDLYDRTDNRHMITDVGRLLHRDMEASTLNNRIDNAFQQLLPFPPKRVAYLIWKDPYIAAGSQTFIDAMLRDLGWTNVFADQSRYPSFTLDELVQRKPELVLLSSEPYPFSDEHLAIIYSILPSSQPILVDGEMFSWYGSRMQWAPAYFDQLRARIV